MNRFDEDIVIGKPFGAVFLGVQWKDGVLQQGWTEKVEHREKSGRYIGTYTRERWDDVPGAPPRCGGDLETGRLGEEETEDAVFERLAKRLLEGPDKPYMRLDDSLPKGEICLEMVLMGAHAWKRAYGARAGTEASKQQSVNFACHSATYYDLPPEEQAKFRIT